MTRIAESEESWQGLPIPVQGYSMALAPGHPLAPAFDRVFPSPESSAEKPVKPSEEYEFTCYREDVKPEIIRNHWWSRHRNADIYIIEGEDGFHHLVIPASPDRSMARLTFWLRGCGVVEAWSLEAEMEARAKLKELISDYHYSMYELTGTFLEHSKRSGLTYMFRKGRPTVVLTSRHGGNSQRKDDNVRVLAVLCLHPVGYYRETWCGAMVPTDDVIAHLVLMRGDEAGLWKKANQHDPASPEAGL